MRFRVAQGRRRRKWLWAVLIALAVVLALVTLSTARNRDGERGESIMAWAGDALSPERLIGWEIPVLGLAEAPPISDMPTPSPQVSDRGDDREAVAVTADVDDAPEAPAEIVIKAQTIDWEASAPVTLSGEGAQVMIYHTHTREAYAQDPEDPYKMEEPWRCDDLSYTVVRVGQELAALLNQKGIPTYHDTTEHEQGDHGTSYTRSLKTLQRCMEQYPSLKVFIDLHRNGYDDGPPTPNQETVVINGERAARFFVLIGTGEGQTTSFTDKPNWEENYKLAKQITAASDRLYPGLAKEVCIRSGRYNQHVSTNAILIEVGSNYTTLKEALATARLLAEILAEVLQGD
jgi:stage II sporulation protein P